MSPEVTDPHDVRLSFSSLVQCFGLMLLMVANDLILREPAVFVEGLGISSYHLPEVRIVLNCTFIATLFVVSAFSLFSGKEPATRFLFLVQAGVGTLSVAFGLWAAWGPVASEHVALLLLFAALGTYASLGLFCWITIFCQLPPRTAWMQVIVALFVSSLGYAFFLYSTETLPAVPLFCIEYAASLAMTGLFAFRKTDAFLPTQEHASSMAAPPPAPVLEESRGMRAKAAVRRNYATVLCITALNFVLTASRTALAGQSDQLVTFICAAGICLAAILLLVASFGTKREIGIKLVYQVAFPFIALAFLLLPFMDIGLRILFMLFATAFGTMASTTLLQIAFVEKRKSGMPACGIYGLASGFVHVFLLAGLLMGLDEVSGGGTELASYIVLAVMLVYVFLLVFLVSRRRSDEKMTAGGGIVFVGTHEEFDRKCQDLASLYGLTQREQEIMHLLMLGNSAEAVADKLGISLNTVRTHSKNLYRKLGIHAKAELVELLNR